MYVFIVSKQDSQLLGLKPYLGYQEVNDQYCIASDGKILMNSLIPIYDW